MQTGVTCATKDIFVVDFDTLFTIGSEIFISRVLPFWQGHRVDAQFTMTNRLDSICQCQLQQYNAESGEIMMKASAAVA